MGALKPQGILDPYHTRSPTLPLGRLQRGKKPRLQKVETDARHALTHLVLGCSIPPKDTHRLVIPSRHLQRASGASGSRVMGLVEWLGSLNGETHTRFGRFLASTRAYNAYSRIEEKSLVWICVLLASTYSPPY